MFGILYLLSPPFSRHRIAINVTVLRCYGVTVSGGWKEGKEKVGNRGSWEQMSQQPLDIPTHARLLATTLTTRIRIL